MSTYTELRQELDRIEKYIQDAIAQLVNAKEPKDKLREELNRVMGEQIRVRVELSSLLEREAKEIAASSDLDDIKFLYRGRRYSASGWWHVYYEKCQVIERKPNYLTVVSQDMDIPGFYKGGKFRVKRDELQSEAKPTIADMENSFTSNPLATVHPSPVVRSLAQTLRLLQSKAQWC
jgi:hypothetical protein